MKIVDKVEAVLRKYPKLRDDDTLLYAAMCWYSNHDVWEMTFGHVMQNHKDLKLPSYESVTRARRKLQEMYPDLRGKRYNERQRAELEYRNEYRKN